MAKCLLLNSPIYRGHRKENEDYLPPLGLGYIATHLQEAGVETKIIDCVKERIGITEIFDMLQREAPDCIGINIFTQNYDIVQEIVENCPISSTIVVGGQVVKCIHREITQWKSSNPMIVLIGEGELIFPDLVLGKCKDPPIFSIEKKSVYRVDKNSTYFPDILSKSHLDRSLFIKYAFSNHYGDNEADIIASRGCMYNCAFCGGAHNLNQDVTIRYRSAEEVVAEIKHILALDPSVSSIRVLDDLFLRDTNSIKTAISIFDGFDNLSWRGMAHVLTFAKENYSLADLKKSGCRELFIGVESGSERIRKTINKPGTIFQVIDVVSAILNADIDVKCYFMYGFPGETAEDAEETFLLAAKLADIAKQAKGNFRTSAFQFRPYHGTKLYNDIIKSGRNIGQMKSNEMLNAYEGRTQFNFYSGNYSEMTDQVLASYIKNTQALSGDRNV